MRGQPVSGGRSVVRELGAGEHVAELLVRRALERVARGNVDADTRRHEVAPDREHLGRGLLAHRVGARLLT
eukprot:10854541-Alexandrium_andersonii.AAC.1